MISGRPRSKHAWAVTTRRRPPVDRQRYSLFAMRAAGKLPRIEHPLAVTAAASAGLAIAGIILLQLVGAGIAAGVAQIGASVVNAIPTPTERPIVLGEAPVTVSAAPVLDGLPEFTRSPQLEVAGRVPGFAALPGREIALLLNGVAVAKPSLFADGRFGPVTLTLPDGASTITAVLLEGDKEIARVDANVVVDRTPPALTIASPKGGDEVTGPDVTIEGTTEPDTELTINGEALRPSVDGRFSVRLTAPPGPLTVNVVARDRAGNEKRAVVQVVVKGGTAAPATGTSLTVALDRTRVRPGETVVATVVATQESRARADLAVTIQVGVVTAGTVRTDATGTARLGFTAPTNEADDIAVVALGGGSSARASLTVSTKP